MRKKYYIRCNRNDRLTNVYAAIDYASNGQKESIYES
jgi:hypothetical protein